MRTPPAHPCTAPSAAHHCSPAVRNCICPTGPRYRSRGSSAWGRTRRRKPAEPHRPPNHEPITLRKALAMLRSLFTGISGLNAHQQMLDVVANNIANVNTTGFKGSTAVFADTLSQTLSGATLPGVNGGTGPMQVGLGVQLVGTDLDLTQGSSQATGVGSNLLINGDGYFM